MSTDVVMPQMGESVAEGTITKWLKRVGDPVKRDEPLFEISTDKVDAEIPAPADGVLVEVVHGEGQTVAVNAVVARIDAPGAATGGDGAKAAPAPKAAAPPPAAPAAPAPAKAAPAPAKPAPAPAAQAPAAKPAPAPAPQPRPAPAAPAPAASEEPAEREELLRTRSTPIVRRIAAEHGVDLAQVTGTGIAGRVTK
ncbi:MAG TPA: biotin/lipoyl-containing protein, partial [Candidatus Udaeobacter sp.]|nr:biotin/lipoyl-containing protein [Candidatus Udaeobacter sp.]